VQSSLVPSPDVDLAARAARGDVWAFEQLVHRHAGMAIGAALRVTRDRGLAEDAAQEAFWKAFRALPLYREEQNFAGWLRRICVRCALDIVRRRRIEVPLSGSEPAPDREEARNRLERALSKLAPLDREILLALKADGRPVAEVARDLEMTAVAVRVRLFRARARVRKALVEE
jgi:RNA polymerase sigma-70 factor (ECF subfamily)